MTRSLVKALAFLQRRLGPLAEGAGFEKEEKTPVERRPSLAVWQWGRLRTRFIDHVFANDAPFLRQLLGSGPVAWGGNYGTLKAHHFEPHSKFRTFRQTDAEEAQQPRDDAKPFPNQRDSRLFCAVLDVENPFSDKFAKGIDTTSFRVVRNQKRAALHPLLQFRCCGQRRCVV